MQMHHFDFVEDIGGFNIENVEFAPNETVTLKILNRGMFTSEQPEFYRYIEPFCARYLYPKNVFIDSVYQFLMVIHADQSGDLYINNFQVNMEVTPKRDMKAGEILMHSDVANSQKVSFPTIKIVATDRIIYCFKVGWRFGLFFDLKTRIEHLESDSLNKDELLDIEAMQISIGDLRRYLLYYETFQILASESQLQGLIKDGWFPFVEIISGEYKALSEIYLDRFSFENRINMFLNGFTEARIKEITGRWWIKGIFSEKKSILEAGVNAYLQNTPDGYINAIKNLLTEIEGILRAIYHIETGKGNRVKSRDLMYHIVEKAKSKSASKISLFLPESFLTYLQDVVFADFDVEKEDIIDLSRNSSSHGVASKDQYTRSRALQAILILDQIYYCI